MPAKFLTSLIALLALLIAAPGRADSAGPSFVRWREPQGLFSAEVPRGWRIEGRIDPQGLDKGAFMIQGFSPDGRAMFAFAHNWQWFMEYQYGRYRPGTATVETLVLPQLPANLAHMGVRDVRVTYRGPNKTFHLPNPLTGMSLRADQGTVGLLASTARGEVLAGSIMAETLHVPMGGTPGLWSLRLFCGGIAPAGAREQAAIRAIQLRVVETLQLSPEFRRIWSDAHRHTTRRMREYSRDMDRVFERYLASARRSSNSRGDPMEAWAEMMREGHYERDERTGEQHWVGNNHQYWWKNDRGDIVGNSTGSPPADHHNWYGLSR